MTFAERTGFLHQDQEMACRSIVVLDSESGSRLLWREDHQCVRLQTLAEGSESIQQEAAKLSLTRTCNSCHDGMIKLQAAALGSSIAIT